MSPVTRINITLDPATIELIDAIKARTAASRSAIIRLGVEAYAQKLVAREKDKSARRLRAMTRAEVIRLLQE